MRAAALAVLALPGPLAAHPHVFVEADVEVVVADGAVTAVRLVWAYDDLFSLILTEDLGLDADGDLVLTPEEEEALAANVLDWPADFAGDLAVTGPDGAPAALAPREDHGVEMAEGRVIETHRRPLAQPLPATAAPVAVQVFDPYYYVAYEVRSVSVSGDPGCTATLREADLDAAQAEVDAIWQDLDVAGAGPEVTLPPIGYAFADTVEVACAG